MLGKCQAAGVTVTSVLPASLPLPCKCCSFRFRDIMFIFSRTFTGNKVRRPRLVDNVLFVRAVYGVYHMAHDLTHNNPPRPSLSLKREKKEKPPNAQHFLFGRRAVTSLCRAHIYASPVAARLSVSTSYLTPPNAHAPLPILAAFPCFRSGSNSSSSRMPDCRVRFEFCRTSCYGRSGWARGWWAAVPRAVLLCSAH